MREGIWRSLQSITMNVEESAKHVPTGFRSQHHHAIARRQLPRAAQSIERHPNRGTTKVAECRCLADDARRRYVQHVCSDLRHAAVGGMNNPPVNAAGFDTCFASDA